MLPFDSYLLPALPPMAWLYRMPRQGRSELFHGKSVELLQNGFFEGCFPGQWQTGNLAECCEVFGSGLRIENGVHCFVTSSHIYESLFIFTRDDELTVSNSLCFLLEFYQVTLPFDLRYSKRFATASRGIDAYDKHLAKTKKGNLSRVIYDNLKVTSDLKVSYARKPLCPPFSNYQSYVQYLTATLESAFANACDTGRGVQFSPLATYSAGYDSATCAAIAKQLGCKDVITLKTSRGGIVDNGLLIGQALRLNVTETEIAPRNLLKNDQISAS